MRTNLTYLLSFFGVIRADLNVYNKVFSVLFNTTGSHYNTTAQLRTSSLILYNDSDHVK